MAKHFPLESSVTGIVKIGPIAKSVTGQKWKPVGPAVMRGLRRSVTRNGESGSRLTILL